MTTIMTMKNIPLKQIHYKGITMQIPQVWEYETEEYNEVIFGDLFDFDGDGNLDVFEQSMEFMFLDELMQNESNDDDLD